MAHLSLFSKPWRSSCEQIDELRLWTFPVVVGNGKRLFEQARVSQRYELVRLEATAGSGAFMSIYRPRREGSNGQG